MRNPETDDLGFVSLMGMQGEHLALALYIGVEGLMRFWRFEQMPDYAPSESLLQIPHLQASFEDRADLSEADRRLIQDLGLRFRGRQAWPSFRSYRPGFFPWQLEAAEARFLTHALEQAVHVAQRFKEDSRILPNLAEGAFLVRVPRKEQETLLWEDQIVTLPPPALPPIPVMIDGAALDVLLALPRTRADVEVDCVFFPARIGP